MLVNNNDQATFNSGYLQSINAVQGQLSTAGSTLGSITNALQQALSLGSRRAVARFPAGDQAAIVNQLQGIQSQLVSLANTSYEGNTYSREPKRVRRPLSSTIRRPSGVDYVGNTDVNQVSIGSGYKLAVNVPGSQLFSAPGNDVFLAINNLIQAVQTNTGIPAAVNAVSAASSYLSAQTVFYGNATDQTQSQTTYLNAAQLQISQQQNTLGGVNLPTAANNLAEAQTGQSGRACCYQQDDRRIISSIICSSAICSKGRILRIQLAIVDASLAHNVLLRDRCHSAAAAK